MKWRQRYIRLIQNMKNLGVYLFLFFRIVCVERFINQKHLF